MVINKKIFSEIKKNDEIGILKIDLKNNQIDKIKK
jgi:hypothetical protein